MSGSGTTSSVLGVLLSVAQIHGSSISLAELAQLMPAGTTLDEVILALQELPSFSERYELREGYVMIRRGSDLPEDSPEERNRTFDTNLEVASWLSSHISDSDVLTMAVSGSTSYRWATTKDDVDVFCVTPKSRMWIFLTKALLFTRASKVLKRENPPICLSCVMDSVFAGENFSTDKGALFARDALVARTVRGDQDYSSLLTSAPWMKSYFPKLYSLRTSGKSEEPIPRDHGTLTEVLNRLLFAVVGRYIITKARLHNRALSKQGKGMAAFRVRIGIDHLIYESAKYRVLKDIYDGIRPATAVEAVPRTQENL